MNGATYDHTSNRWIKPADTDVTDDQQLWLLLVRIGELQGELHAAIAEALRLARSAPPVRL